MYLSPCLSGRSQRLYTTVALSLQTAAASFERYRQSGSLRCLSYKTLLLPRLPRLPPLERSYHSLPHASVVIALLGCTFSWRAILTSAPQPAAALPQVPASTPSPARRPVRCARLHACPPALAAFPSTSSRAPPLFCLSPTSAFRLRRTQKELPCCPTNQHAHPPPRLLLPRTLSAARRRRFPSCNAPASPISRQHVHQGRTHLRLRPLDHRQGPVRCFEKCKLRCLECQDGQTRREV